MRYDAREILKTLEMAQSAIGNAQVVEALHPDFDEVGHALLEAMAGVAAIRQEWERRISAAPGGILNGPDEENFRADLKRELSGTINLLIGFAPRALAKMVEGLSGALALSYERQLKAVAKLCGVEKWFLDEEQRRAIGAFEKAPLRGVGTTNRAQQMWSTIDGKRKGVPKQPEKTLDAEKPQQREKAPATAQREAVQDEVYEEMAG